MVLVTDIKPVWVTLIIATAMVLSARTAFAESPAKVPSVPATVESSTGQVGTVENAPNIRQPEVVDPDIRDVDVEIRVPEVESPDVQVPEFEVPEVEVPDVNVPDIPDIDVPGQD